MKFITFWLILIAVSFASVPASAGAQEQKKIKNLLHLLQAYHCCKFNDEPDFDVRILNRIDAIAARIGWTEENIKRLNREFQVGDSECRKGSKFMRTAEKLLQEFNKEPDAPNPLLSDDKLKSKDKKPGPDDVLNGRVDSAVNSPRFNALRIACGNGKVFAAFEKEKSKGDEIPDPVAYCSRLRKHSLEVELGVPQTSQFAFDQDILGAYRENAGIMFLDRSTDTALAHLKILNAKIEDKPEGDNVLAIALDPKNHTQVLPESRISERKPEQDLRLGLETALDVGYTFAVLDAKAHPDKQIEPKAPLGKLVPFIALCTAGSGLSRNNCKIVGSEEAKHHLLEVRNRQKAR